MAKIKTVTLKDGSKRFEITVDTGRDPKTGKRQQTRRRYTLLREAKAELARIGHEVGTGKYVRRWDGTVAELLDDWFASATFGKQANTVVSYRTALLPVRARLGYRKAQSVERRDVEQLRDWMLTAGRKRGGQPGTGLSARSARLTLGLLKAAFEQACEDGKLYRNPCRGVTLPELPAQEDTEDQRWSAAEVRRFLAEAAGDRLAVAWRLALYGLRREEVLGLRWCNVDLAAGTLTIAVCRVLVDGQVVVKGPKHANSKRTLPLAPDDVTALQALADRQVTEAMEAADAYTDSGYVVTDELGREVHPDWFTDEFHRIRERAALRRITLRNARKTANSLMADAGVPSHIRAAWCGHTEAVNKVVYTRADAEGMAVALAGLTTMIEKAV